MNPQVLVVSRDEMLLHTRQLILGAFFQVYGAGRIREVEDLISRRRFDLIILCYTLTESDCQRVMDLVGRQKTRPRILVLSPAGSRPPETESSLVMMTEAGPYYLLKKTAEMLGVDIKAKASLAEA
jgi:DNA-binding response OmpR family regulator